MSNKILLAAMVVIFSFTGCKGSQGMGSTDDPKSGITNAPGVSNDPNDQYAACTDQATCCTQSQTQCVYSPDQPAVCTCYGLWDCGINPKKCSQAMPIPPGGGEWTCTWSASQYVCKGNTSTGGAPSGAGWDCQFVTAENAYVCSKTSPNPSNKPAGSSEWNCTVDNEFDKLTCDRETPSVKIEENCVDGIDNDGDGLTDCLDPDCPCNNPGTGTGTGSGTSPGTGTGTGSGTSPGTGSGSGGWSVCPVCKGCKECCDGLDNDQDGVIDEGNVCGTWGAEPCPPNAVQACDCYCGVHRRCLADGTWGPCTVDGTGKCNVAAITSQSQCGFGQYCDYGKCVYGSIDNQCKSHNDCTGGKICDLGYCVTDNYKPCP